jgi:hypothetical protein
LAGERKIHHRIAPITNTVSTTKNVFSSVAAESGGPYLDSLASLNHHGLEFYLSTPVERFRIALADRGTRSRANHRKCRPPFMRLKVQFFDGIDPCQKRFRLGKPCGFKLAVLDVRLGIPLAAMQTSAAFHACAI